MKVVMRSRASSCSGGSSRSRSSDSCNLTGRMKQRKTGGNALPFCSSSRKKSRLKQVVVARLLRPWSTFWLCCVLALIGIWIFCLAAVPPHLDDSGEHGPSITIFAAPRSFCCSSSTGGLQGIVEASQELAVRSWLALSPDIAVILFGQHPSIHAFAEALGPRVSVESSIDFTFLGTPFFHSMVSRMQASNSDISVLVDPETILFPNFITILHHANELDKDWFLVSASANVSHFPFHLDGTGKSWLNENGVQIKFEKEFLVQNQHPSCCCERVLLAWNTGSVPLHAGVLPPFLYGKGIHNQWLISEVLSSDFRLVLDASEAVSFYPERSGHWTTETMASSDKEDADDSFWESKCNSHLASLYGSLYLQHNKGHSSIARVVKCKGQYFFTSASEKRAYPPIQDPDKAGLLKRGHLPSKIKKWRACVENKSLERENKCSILKLLEVGFEPPASLSQPFSLESLLKMVADEDKTVVLAVAGDSYRDMLMSWVCRLRQLSVTNFLISALDTETYQFSVLQGLPVFIDPLSPSNISFNDCHFGSDCFPRVTKAKSRLVLQIMKLGYNVLLSDVDIYWFQNPLPLLRSFGPAVLAAQSDEYNETVPINLPRRLNSGFYFARSDVPTISALEKVVKHASTSGLSEQPSFYDVLCGEEGGINRVGSDRCLEPETNLTVQFLDRNLFPNGAFQGLWEETDVESACRKKGCVILHNNWISGRERKLDRQVRSGLWAYDASSRMCPQSWHRNISMG